MHHNLTMNASQVEPKVKRRGKVAETTVIKENFKDFAENSFKITINRIQQLTLQKVGMKLPTPKEQLEMVNKRREAKKSRTGAASHS
jgi:hypothetical protein